MRTRWSRGGSNRSHPRWMKSREPSPTSGLAPPAQRNCSRVHDNPDPSEVIAELLILIAAAGAACSSRVGVCIAVLARGYSCRTAEGAPEGCGVEVADGGADLLDGLVGGLQEFLGQENPGLLHVGVDAGAGGGVKPARQGAGAYVEYSGQGVGSDRRAGVAVDVDLCPPDQVVAVMTHRVIGQVGKLTGAAAIDEQHLAGKGGALVAAEAFNQIDRQREERGGAAAGDCITGVDDEAVTGDPDRRIPCLKGLGEHPMGGGRAPVEQSGLGEQKRSDARRRDASSPVVPCLEPWHPGTVLRERI